MSLKQEPGMKLNNGTANKCDQWDVGEFRK